MDCDLGQHSMMELRDGGVLQQSTVATVDSYSVNKLNLEVGQPGGFSTPSKEVDGSTSSAKFSKKCVFCISKSECAGTPSSGNSLPHTTHLNSVSGKRLKVD